LPVERPAGRLSPVAKYDAARTHTDNREHWRLADGASANAANSADVRRILRNRARYEDDNNSYVNGLTGDRANETVGTGPRLQLTLPEERTDPATGRTVTLTGGDDAAREVECRWAEWCETVGLLDKLLVMDESETREGEAFGLKFINPALPADAPQLDLRVYEADQIDTPEFRADQPVSGIEYDRYGNPTYYHVLKQHPGDAVGFGPTSLEYDRVPARQMIHLFKPRRAGQGRGVPGWTSSLPQCAILRRFTLASLLTAEAQSRINAVITQQQQVADDGSAGDDDDDAAGEQIRYAGTHMLTLSAGQDAKTLPASAPPPNYREFKGEILTEAGRTLNAPGNVSRGTSADMNYSSGRLDQQQWQRAIRIRRRRLERIVLNVLFAEWLRLARFIPGYLPAELPPERLWKRKWRWDAFVSIDPVKDATAATERLDNGTSSLERECGDLGEDWEEVQDQRLREEAREARRRTDLGLGPKLPRSPKPILSGNGSDE
jgi:lambda family phage portal protein